jgi:hypothetical protein
MARSISSRTVSSAVSGPRTTSTSRMSGTGLKKCMPAMRSRRRHGLAMAAMSSEEVLEARMQSSPTMPSSSQKTLLLERQILEHRLDDDAAGRKVLEGLGDLDPAPHGLHIIGAEPSLLDARSRRLNTCSTPALAAPAWHRAPRR